MKLNKIIFTDKDKLNDSNYNLISFNKFIKNKKILFYDHPWENFKNYESDYFTLLNKKKKILTVLSNSLNKIHNKSYSEKYWNILLGTFIISFLTTYLDSKTSVKFLKKKFKKNNLYYDELIFKDKFIPNTTSEFNINLYNGKFYEFIFQSFLIKRFKKTKFKKKLFYKSKNSSIVERLKILIFPLIFKFFKKFFYKKILFIKSYFSYKEQSKILSLITKKRNLFIPNFSFFFKKKINVSMRKKFLIELNKNSNKKTRINNLISKLLPTVFLENYENYFLLEKKIFPFAPKVIINGIGDISRKDELTKFFIARLLENKTIILTRQHGGVYGSSKFSIFEKLQKENSNFFLTFGWKTCSNDIPISFPNINKKLLPSRNKKILLINVCFPKFFHNYFPSPQSNKYIIYLNNLSLILNNSKKEIHIREYFENFGWRISDFIKNYDDFHKDKSTSLIKSLNNYNLAIVTYDSTTHLETFSLNFPTIIFFSKEYYSFSNKYSEKLNILKSVNVFFDDVNEMLQFINNDDFNINEWWFSHKVQSAINLFNLNYSNKKSNYEVDWVNFINKIKF